MALDFKKLIASKVENFNSDVEVHVILLFLLKIHQNTASYKKIQ